MAVEKKDNEKDEKKVQSEGAQNKAATNAPQPVGNQPAKPQDVAGKQQEAKGVNEANPRKPHEGKIEPRFKEYSRTNPVKLFADHLQSIGTGLKFLVKPQRITLFYPEEALSLPTGYRGLIRLYKDVCIGCTLCALICPADAMKMTTDEGKKIPAINYGRCVFCGFCVDVCPVDALKETRVHDVAFSNRRDLVFSPDKFNRNFDQPISMDRPVRKMKTVIDEKKGIKYVPDE